MMRKLWILAAAALMFGLTSCDKDNGGDDDSSTIAGTYKGEIEAYIAGMVDDTFEQDFTVKQENGKTTLSITLSIPIAQLDRNVDMEIKNLELVGLTSYDNITVEDDDATGTFSGTCFNMAPYTYTIPVVGGSIALTGDYAIDINGTDYHGFQGNVKIGATSVNGMFALSIKGTASGGPFPQELPVNIEVYGVKK